MSAPSKWRCNCVQDGRLPKAQPNQAHAPAKFLLQKWTWHRQHQSAYKHACSGAMLPMAPEKHCHTHCSMTARCSQGYKRGEPSGLLRRDQANPPRSGSRNVNEPAASRLAMSNTQTEGTRMSCKMVTRGFVSFRSTLSTAEGASVTFIQLA